MGIVNAFQKIHNNMGVCHFKHGLFEKTNDNCNLYSQHSPRGGKTMVGNCTYPQIKNSSCKSITGGIFLYK